MSITPFPTEDLYIGKLHPETVSPGEPQWKYTEEGVWERVHLFHDVAYTGDYNDLLNKPILPQTIVATQGEFLNAYDATTGLFSTATIDLSGYATEDWVTDNFLQTQVQSDWNVTDTESAAYILNKPTIESSLWSEGSSQIHRDGHVTIGTNANSSYKEGLTVVGLPEPGQSYPNYPFAVIKHGTDISESFGFVNNILFSVFRSSSESWGLLAKFMPSETEWDGTSVEFDRVLVQDNNGRIVYANRSEFGEGEGGVTNFTGLTDTPSNYTGSGGKIVAVNSGATGLEFVDPSGGSMEIHGNEYHDPDFITSLAHTHGVANAGGTQQFTYGVGDNIRFEGAGATSVSFDSNTKKVTITSEAEGGMEIHGNEYHDPDFLTSLPTHSITGNDHSGFDEDDTTNFLRADGNWAEPAGGSGLPDGSVNDTLRHSESEWVTNPNLKSTETLTEVINTFQTKAAIFKTQQEETITSDSLKYIYFEHSNFCKVNLWGGGVNNLTIAYNIVGKDTFHEIGRYELLLIYPSTGTPDVVWSGHDSEPKVIYWPFGEPIFEAGLPGQKCLITFRYDGSSYVAIPTPWFGQATDRHKLTIDTNADSDPGGDPAIIELSKSGYSETKVTDDSGNAYFDNLANDTYNYTATHDNATNSPVTGTLTISGVDKTYEIVFTFEL